MQDLGISPTIILYNPFSLFVAKNIVLLNFGKLINLENNSLIFQFEKIMLKMSGRSAVIIESDSEKPVSGVLVVILGSAILDFFM